MIDRDILMFRETRTGSTGVSSYLASVLQRECILVSNLYHDKIDAVKNLVTTHDFDSLYHLDQFTNPILLRCSRRNKVEHMLSQKTAYYTNNALLNIYQDPNIEPVNVDALLKYKAYGQTHRILVEYTVNDWCRRQKLVDAAWNEVSPKYDNFTFYYEDIGTSIDIPLLNLYNYKIGSWTNKLPDFKREVYINYDQIEAWIEKHYDPT